MKTTQPFPKGQAFLLTEQKKESKTDNNQPIGKQHADNQSELDTSLRGGKREEQEETGTGKKSK